MTVKEIMEALNLENVSGQEGLDMEVTGGYTSDLLSDVIANSKEGNLWITLQTHQNVIAVAEMSNGEVYMSKAEVKVTIGGCGG